jgi:tRNA threonylcarbamoyladenosine biosynthesis protein TsaE
MLQLPRLNAAAMSAFARSMAAIARAGDCIALHGDLGAGKTFFAQSFIRALCGEATDVASPTFMIAQTYSATDGGSIAHFDLYRLEHSHEVEETGLPETLLHHINLIEWPDIASAYLPPHTLHIVFAFNNSPDYRDLALTGYDAWMTRLPPLPFSPNP